MTGCCREKQEGKLILAKDGGDSTAHVSSRLAVTAELARDPGHTFLRTRASQAAVQSFQAYLRCISTSRFQSLDKRSV